FGLTERESVFDREVLTFDVAKISQPGAQRLNQVGETGGREIAKTDHLCWLLRARRERPRSCAADERDELSPLHVCPLPRLAQPARVACRALRVSWRDRLGPWGRPELF